MTFEQLHDLYFSQESAAYDEQALRYFWDAAVAEERDRCAKIAEELEVEWETALHPDRDRPGEFRTHDDDTCRLCIAAAIRETP